MAIEYQEKDGTIKREIYVEILRQIEESGGTISAEKMTNNFHGDISLFLPYLKKMEKAKIVKGQLMHFGLASFGMCYSLTPENKILIKNTLNAMENMEHFYSKIK